MQHNDELPEKDSLAQWKGWYYSGAAPHRDVPGACQFITFRLADSLPQSVLRNLNAQKKRLLGQELSRYKRWNLERWLDAGLGCCILARPEMAQVLREALFYHHGQRYQLIAWCIMPNHVHVLIDPSYPLHRIVQPWKSFTTRWALLHNDRLGLGVLGRTLWMRDYWDRFIRDEQHLQATIDYIHQNPVKAGLCGSANEWQWSSAFEMQIPAT